jgi:hypothetical protein
MAAKKREIVDLDEDQKKGRFAISEKKAKLPEIQIPRIHTNDREFHPCLPAYNAFVLLLGGPKSGKTSTTIGMLKTKGLLHKRYHKIWYFNPNPHTMAGKLPLHPDRQFTEYNAENLETIENEAAHDGLNHFVWFDDMLGEMKKNDSHMKRFAWNRRHISGSLMKPEDKKKLKGPGSVTVFMTAQRLRDFPASFRDCVTEVMCWRVDGRTLEAFNEEFLEGMNPVLRAKLVDRCWREPHDFIYVKREKDKHGRPRVFHNFDPIEIEEISASLGMPLESAAAAAATADSESESGEESD